MSLAKYQEILQLIERIEKADRELSRDLWLITERLVLNRLISRKEKGAELRSLVEAIKQVISQRKPGNGHGDVLELNLPEANDYDNVNTSSAFSAVVDCLERMDSNEIYKLISWLRNDKTA